MKNLLIGLTFIFLLCFAGSCMAVADFTIDKNVLYDPDTRTMALMINDNRTSGPDPESADVSFDGTYLLETAYFPISDVDVPITFCFVVDTTPTAFTYQTKLADQIANAFYKFREGKTDDYLLISYDTEVHEAIGPVNNPKNVFNELTYAGGHVVGDYSEALLKAVDLLNSQNTFSKKVIIWITDGNQVQKPFLQDGGEKGLFKRLEQAEYPIFSFGLMQSETEEYMTGLEKLADISAATGGLYYCYKDNKNPEKEYFEQIKRSGVVIGKVSSNYGRNEEGLADITVKLLRSNQSDLQSVKSVVVLPRIQGENTYAYVAPKIEEPEGLWEKIQNILQDKLGDKWAYIAGGVLILLVLIILIIIIASSGKSKKTGNKASAKKQSGGKSSEDNKEVTVIESTQALTGIGGGNAFSNKDRNTVNVNLKEVKTGRVFSATIKNGSSMRFGRLDDKTNNVVGLGGDTHISRKQFQMTNENGRIVLEDPGSENGTYVDNEKVIGKVNLRNGSTLRVGPVAGEREFTVILTTM